MFLRSEFFISVTFRNNYQEMFLRKSVCKNKAKIIEKNE